MNNTAIAVSFLAGLILFSSCEKDDGNNPPIQINELHDVLVLPDGSTLIAGTFGNRIRLIRTTSSFIPLWQQQNYPWGINLKEMTFGSTGYMAYVTDLFLNTVGNFICVVSTIEGSCVIYSTTVISELNAAGDEVRSVQFEGGGLNPYHVVQCTDGGFLLIGRDKFIKLNGTLEKVWEKEKINSIYALRVNKENQYVSTGSFDNYHVNIRLWDENMNEIFTSVIGETSGFGEEAGYDVMPFDDEGYLVAGRSRHYTGNFNMDGFLIRTDNSGDTVWTRRFGDENDQYFEKVVHADNEMIIVQGNQGGRGEPDERKVFLKTSADGEFLDTSYWNVSTSFYKKNADQFLKITQSDAGVLNIIQIGIDEIFSQ